MVLVGCELMEPGGALGANQLTLFFENGKLENRVARGRKRPRATLFSCFVTVPVLHACRGRGRVRWLMQLTGGWRNGRVCRLRVGFSVPRPSLP
jgi:hypothetical protein